MTNATTSSTVETAAAPVMLSLSIWPKMLTAATCVSNGMLPEMRTVEPNSLIDRAKARAVPDSIAGRRLGRMTRRKIVPLPAPKDAAASLGAGKRTIFRRVILPALLPAMLSGTALAFARSISEFGSTVLISGNIPFETQVAAVSIFGQIESDNMTGAAAVSTVLLVVALIMLVSLDLLQRWGSRRG